MIIAIQLLVLILISCLITRCLSRTSLLHLWHRIEDGCHVYQSYKVPQFNDCMQENQLYTKILTYLNSLPSLEDSDRTNLFSSGTNPNEIVLALDRDQTIIDEFLGARIYWNVRSQQMVLGLRRKDKRRVLRPYLQHIHTICDELAVRRKEIKLYINSERDGIGRWRSIPFTHPATIDTVIMDTDLKNRLKNDLEMFLKSKHVYSRLGRVWKRSYLLYGPSGTGKSSFVSAIAKLLSYDVYDVDLSKLTCDSDLKMMLLQTTSKSLIVVEDLDRYLGEKSTALSLSGILNFMDGIISCCGEERVMVFTMNDKDRVDPTVLRPGRIDVHVKFDLCDFSSFKSLASNYLGITEHKLFSQVEEIFLSGPSLSPAEIGELMIANRSSPSRALKSVISALQNNVDYKFSARIGKRLDGPGTGPVRTSDEPVVESGSFFCREGGNTMKEFKKLYGLLRVKSSRRSSMDFDSVEKENLEQQSLSR